LKVLIAEDDTISRMILKKWLSSKKYFPGEELQECAGVIIRKPHRIIFQCPAWSPQKLHLVVLGNPLIL
jgi:hypothetical protein